MTGAYDTAAAHAATAVARSYSGHASVPATQAMVREQTPPKAETLSIRNAAGVIVADNVGPRYAAAIQTAVDRSDAIEADLRAKWPQAMREAAEGA